MPKPRAAVSQKVLILIVWGLSCHGKLHVDMLKNILNYVSSDDWICSDKTLLHSFISLNKSCFFVFVRLFFHYEVEFQQQKPPANKSWLWIFSPQFWTLMIWCVSCWPTTLHFWDNLHVGLSLWTCHVGTFFTQRCFGQRWLLTKKDTAHTKDGTNRHHHVQAPPEKSAKRKVHPPSRVSWPCICSL